MAAAGRRPQRPGMLLTDIEGLYDARSCTAGPAGSTCRCCPRRSPVPTAAACARPPSTYPDALPERDENEIAFRFGLVISHENQHDETMLAGDQPAHRGTVDSAANCAAARSIRRGGYIGASSRWAVVLGVDPDTEPLSLDNERPAHVVDVPAFRIGTVPVTNAEWRCSSSPTAATGSRGGGRRGLGAPPVAALTAPAVLERRRQPHPVRSGRGHPR